MERPKVEMSGKWHLFGRLTRVVSRGERCVVGLAPSGAARIDWGLRAEWVGLASTKGAIEGLLRRERLPRADWRGPPI